MARETSVRGMSPAPEAAGRAGLTRDHRRALSVLLQHIDGLLGDAQRAISERGMAFPRHTQDLSGPRQQVILAGIASLREKLVEAARELGLPAASPRSSVSRAVDVAIEFAEIAVEDGAPARRAGYGQVTPASAALVQAVATCLMAELARLRRAVVETEDAAHATIGAAPSAIEGNQR